MGNTTSSTTTSLNAKHSKCVSELKSEFTKLKVSMGNNFNTASKKKNALIAFGTGAVKTANSYIDIAESLGASIKDKITNPFKTIVVGLVKTVTLPARLIKGASNLSKTIGSAGEQAITIGQDISDGKYSVQDILNLLESMLSEVTGETACSLKNIVSDINKNPNSLVEATGGLSAEILIQVGLALTTSGAANAAAAGLKAGKLGKAGINIIKPIQSYLKKAGITSKDSLAQMIAKDKIRRKNLSKTPNEKFNLKPGGGVLTTKNQASTKNNNNGKPDSQKNCSPTTKCPVNPVQGIKVLMGTEDTDFVLTGNLPLIWDRQYSSNSKVGRGRTGDPIGWYGQGWSNSWGMQLYIKPSEDLIEVIDTYGRIIRFPYMAIGSSFYSRYEDIRLHHDDVGQYRITSGSSEEGDGIQLHFGSPATNESLTYPHKQRLYCTGQSDSYGNRITLEYGKSAEQSHLPCYIKDSAGRLLQLNFDLIKNAEDKGLRLQKIVQLIGLTDDKLPQLLSVLDKKSQQQLEQADKTDSYAFVSQIQELIAAGKLSNKILDQHTLVSYHYDKKGDLIEANPYLNPTRRFDYKNHIMTAHHIDGGISSYYEYDEYLLSGKVQVNRISSGETYHFDYQDDHTVVIEAKNTANERQMLYHFNKDKRWTGITDALGNRTTFILDRYDRTVKIVNPDGSITENQYTGDNLTAVKQLVDYNQLTSMPLWRTQQYLYKNNRLTELLDPHGNSTELAYDAAGQIKQVTDANGNATHIQRDDKGRTTKQTLANGSSFSYQYNDKGELTSQTDCSGNPTHYHYDDIGRIIRIIDAKDQQTTLTYDHTHSGLTQDTQAPTRIHYPDGSSESFLYDALNRLLKHTDAKDQTTQYQYTDDSLPIKRIDALGHTLEYNYDNLRRLITLTNENGEDWTFNYDKVDNLISETRFDGYTSHYDYDKAGQLVHQTDNPSGKRDEQKHTYLQRDLLGQLTYKHSLDIIKPNGNVSNQSQQRHHKTKYQYDIAGQLLTAISPDASTHLEYDNIGQLISERLTRHHKSHNQDPLEQSKDKTLIQTLTHQYDEIGNRITTTLPDGKVINQLYYGSGHLYNQSITDNEGSITEIRHSERDALHQETTRHQGELLSSFGYDAMGRLTKQYSSDHNKGRIVVERNYSYDILGQLTHLSGQTQLNSKAKNNSTASNSTNSLFQRNHQYDYDKVGRLTQHKLTDYTQQSGTTEHFAFDPASNRVPVSTVANEDKDSLNNSIHKSGTPQQLITANKLITYTYGIHGQVLFKTLTPAKDGKPIAQSSNALVSSRKSIQHYYNPNNELVKTITNTEEGFNLTEITATYYYDAFGRRIAKTSDTKVKTKFINDKHLKTVKYHLQKQKTQHKSIYYLWDGNRQAQEYTNTHVFTTVYEQNSFEPVARLVWLKDALLKSANDAIINAPRERWEDEPKLIPSMQVYHYHNDHLGTPNELTNNQGEVVWLADYEAWGNTAKVVWREEKLEQLQVSADELQPIRFQGQSFDTETGLHYNRFRYFDPDLGMFISRDPIGLMGGNNVYQYAPNPTEWIDPFGLARCNGYGTVKKPFKYPEEPGKAVSFNEARRKAQQEAGMIGKSTIPFLQTLGPQKGRVSGSQTADRARHWRSDFDPNDKSKGFHVNWYRKEQDKKGCWHEYKGYFAVVGGEEDDYLKSIAHFPKL